MESQSISFGDLFSVELFVGSITFVLGTVLFFLLLLLNLRLNLKTPKYKENSRKRDNKYQLQTTI
jgi:hypothetical protein